MHRPSRARARADSLAVSLAITLAAASSAPALAQTVTLKFASFEPPQAPFTARVFATWAEDVTRASNGALKVELFAGGTLGRNPLQQFKLVQDGVADIAWVVPGYTPGRFDDTEVAELPFLVRSAMEGGKVFSRLLAKDQLVGFADIKVLMLAMVPPVNIHTRFPLKSLTDLKGKRLRVGSTVGSKIAEALGAVPVLIGAPNTAEALSKGVVDGTFAEWVFVQAFKIDEVTQQHTLTPLGGTAVMIPMLKKRFDALPPAAKAAIEKHGGAALLERFAAIADGLQVSVPEALAKRGKNTMYKPDKATEDAFRAAVQSVSDDWRKQKPRNDRVYRAFVAELEQVRAGK